MSCELSELTPQGRCCLEPPSPMDPSLNLLSQCHDRQTDLILLRAEQFLKGVVAFDQTLRLINGVSQSAVLQQDLRRQSQ